MCSSVDCLNAMSQTVAGLKPILCFRLSASLCSTNRFCALWPVRLLSSFPSRPPLLPHVSLFNVAGSAAVGQDDGLQGTNEPEYNTTFAVQINRKSRSMARIIKTKGIKCEVYVKM